MAKRHEKTGPLVNCYLRVEEVDKKSRRRLFEQSRLVQEATNRIWHRWEHEMISQGRDADLRIFLELYKRWAETGKQDERPTCEFYVITPEFRNRMYHELAESFPTLHVKVRNLILEQTCNRIRNLPAQKTGKLKLWQAVLLGREAPSRSFDRLPIPFWHENAKLRELDNGRIEVQLRCDRYERPDSSIAGSHVDVLVVIPKDNRYGQLAREAARGQRNWAASSVVYNTQKRRWFVALVVEADPVPKPPEKPTTWATLEAPESGACWRLVVGGETILIGSGRYVKVLRERVRLAKQIRRADPFRAPGRNGRGRRRLLRDWLSQSGRFNRAAQTLNYQLAARVLAEMEARGVRALEYTPPGPKSLINTVGRQQGEKRGEWPCYQVQEILARKCRDKGVALRILKATGDVSDGEQSSSADSGGE